ncbi:lipoate--protein ligase family protein [Haloferacaceae archaeon DSL9]
MSELAAREWRLIREETRSGPMNMALDEIAAETAADGGPRTVRVYQWLPSCLSLGYHQDPTTVDWGACERSGIDVTRRQTGGGGIYHDEYGDISYSITAPADELPSKLMDCYRLLCTPVLDAFERMGVHADFVDEEYPELHRPACYLRALHPAHDIVAGGRKISGNAQYRRRDAVIQHGSITYSVLADRHLSTFAAPDVTPPVFGDRVTGIDEHCDLDRDAAVSALERTLASWADATEGSWTAAELARARERADEKYESTDWVRRTPGGRSDG